jgi:hypothetical protein
MIRHGRLPQLKEIVRVKFFEKNPDVAKAWTIDIRHKEP